MRCQPGPRIFWKNGAAQVEQGWRLVGEQCHSHYRYRTPTIGCSHAGLQNPGLFTLFPTSMPLPRVDFEVALACREHHRCPPATCPLRAIAGEPENDTQPGPDTTGWTNSMSALTKTDIWQGSANGDHWRAIFARIIVWRGRSVADAGCRSSTNCAMRQSDKLPNNASFYFLSCSWITYALNIRRFA